MCVESSADDRGCGSQEEPAFGHRVVGVDVDLDASHCQFGPTGFDEVDHFGFSAGAVDDGHRDGDTSCGDLIDDLVGFGAVLNDEIELEFTFEPEDGENVVGSMGVKVHGAASGEDFGERFESEVAFWRRDVVLLGPVLLSVLEVGVPFGSVLCGLDEFGSLQCGDFHPGDGRLSLGPVGPFGVFAVGHFQATEVSVGTDPHLFGAVASQLDIDGLSSDDVPAAGHDVGGGDATGLGHADAGIEGVDGIESPHDALHGAAAFVPIAVGFFQWPGGDAQMRVAIDESGDDHLAADVNDPGVLGDLDGVDGTDVEDGPVADDESPRGDGLAASRQDPGTSEGDRRGIGGLGLVGQPVEPGQNGERGQPRCVSRLHHEDSCHGSEGVVWWSWQCGFSSGWSRGVEESGRSQASALLATSFIFWSPVRQTARGSCFQ